MTRKDYIAIARACRDAQDAERYAMQDRPKDAETWTRHGMAVVFNHIASALADDNPRFDREHFLAVVRGERDLNSRPPRQIGHPDSLMRDDSQG